jgi:hypothetical protein
MIFKIAETRDHQWHLDEANKLAGEIKTLKAELKYKERLKQKHLDIAQSIMQGQFEIEY